MLDFALLIAALLCSLLAGFLFAFAVVVMPGIRALPDREFLRAFQAIDGVIQRGSVWFFVVWVGSTLSLIVAAGLAFVDGDGPSPWPLLGLAVTHVVGVQAPTAAIHLPLNNRVQALDLDTLDLDNPEGASVAAERTRFEQSWNRSNVFRTWVAVAVAAGLVWLR